jgi:hypothetical protein
MIPMFNRNRLDRERMEVYLVHLLLAWRPLLLVGGLLLLAYAFSVMVRSFFAGGVMLLLAAFPLLLGYSYHAVVFTARLGAWIATLGRKS